MQDQSLIKHLDALRTFILRSAVGLVVGVAAAFTGISFIFEILSKPYLQYLTSQGLSSVGALKSLSPADTFKVSFQAALLFGFGLSSPWILYQGWQFVAPALYPKEKKHTLVFALLVSFFFMAGACFAYFFVLPTAISFFHAYSYQMGILPEWTIENYFNFVILFLAGFGLVFELPVAILILSWFGLVSAAWLSSKRRLVIVGIFIVAAIMTPPDVISQMMMGVPMLVLYEISIWMARLIERVRHKNQSR